MSSPKADFRRAICDASVDRALRTLRVFLRAGWTDKTSQVELNLKSVEWAEFGACARLLALTEGLIRHGFSVKICLPNPRRSKGEERFVAESLQNVDRRKHRKVLDDLKRRVLGRQACLTYLGFTGFLDAVRCEHLLGEFSSRVTITNPDRALGGHPIRNFPTKVPLTWIPVQGAANPAWQERAVNFFYDQGLVMTYSDAESLVTTVLGHLVENVVDHAQEKGRASPAALFGAVALNRSGDRYQPRVSMFYEAVGEYFDWLSHQDSPIVRLVVADSGVGLVSSLLPKYQERQRWGNRHRSRLLSQENARCTAFAFEPTASRHDPGLRRGVGLTTVRRFVRSNRGLVTIRTSNVCTGFECRTGHPELLSEVGLPYAPGTSVEVLLGLTLRARRRLEKAGRISVESADLVLVAASMQQKGLTLFSRLHEEIEKAGAKLPVVVLQVHDWVLDRDLRGGFAAILASVAKDLYGTAGLAVLVEGASEADCSTTFQALDELRAVEEADDSQESEWIPPFMVLGATGRPRWSGASPQLREIMYRMLEGKWIEVDKEEVSGLSTRDREYLQTERDWLMVDKTGRVSLRVGPKEIDEQLAKNLAAKLDRQLERLAGPAS